MEQERTSEYLSQFNTLNIQFSHLMEVNSLDGNHAEIINNFVTNSNTELRRWRASLGEEIVMLEIEELITTLVNNIDQRVYGHVQRLSEQMKSKSSFPKTEYEMQTIREKSVEDWKWLENISNLIQIHVKNAAEYHLFHHMLLQYQQSIQLIHFQENFKEDNNETESHKIIDTIKTKTLCYLNWWQKIEVLISRSRNVCPIGLRQNLVHVKRPCYMVMDLKRDDIRLRKGETVFLTTAENDGSYWIENGDLERIERVPSICFELSPPDIDSIDSAVSLRSDLLSSWTVTIKEIGYTVMKYVAASLITLTDIDLSPLQDPDDSVYNVSKSLDAMESLLKLYSTNSTDQFGIQCKINVLRVELEINTKDEIDDLFRIMKNTMFIDMSPKIFAIQECHNSNSNKNTFQKEALNAIVKLYKEFHGYWNNYKTLTELTEPITKTSGKNYDEYVERSSEQFMKLHINNHIKTTKPDDLLILNHRKDKSNSNLKTKREVSLRKCDSHPQPVRSTSLNIDQYFTCSLFPRQANTEFTLNSQRNTNTNNSKTSTLVDSSKPFSNQKLKSNTMPRMLSREWNRDLYWKENRIQPYYLVISVPRIDRIEAVINRRYNTSMTPSQAKRAGLSDEHFLEILDTETHLKYPFNEAINKGLIILAPSNKISSSSCNNFEKIVFKIDGILNPSNEEWISLREAVDRDIVNCRSGQIKYNKTDFCHILGAMTKENMRSRRIFNCNIKSLPPEMTIRIQGTF